MLYLPAAKAGKLSLTESSLASEMPSATPFTLAEVIPVRRCPRRIAEKAWPDMAHPISSVLGIGTSSMVGAGAGRGGGGAGNAKVDMVTERLDSVDQPIAFLARTVKL
jgi:hypothetical protein